MTQSARSAQQAVTAADLSDYFRSLRLDRDVEESHKDEECLKAMTTQVGRGKPVDVSESPVLISRLEVGAGAGSARIEGLASPQQRLFLLPPQLPEFRNRNLLVIDLDETLVHSSSSPNSYHPQTDFVLPIDVDGRVCNIYVKTRPFVTEFLRCVGSLFEVVIFTASLEKYAAPLIQRLDPEGRYCHHQLYREHCTFSEGCYVKDLTLLGRPLSKVAIIDNSPAAYLYQPRNAIPCTTWFDDITDRELQQFLPFLQLLSAADDVYPILDAYHELLQKHA